jgi:hypothetical protein
MSSEEYTAQIEDANEQDVMLVPISPDQHYHNNGKFTSVIRYISENNLKAEIVIADYLRRFTFQMTGQFDEKESIQQAQKIGPGWKKRNIESTANKEICEKLIKEGKLTIVSWNEFIEKYKDKFLEFQKKVEKEFAKETSNFHIAVIQAKAGFCKTFKEKNSTNSFFTDEIATPEHMDPLSIKYILEECAMMLLWDFLGYKQMAYPISESITNKKIFNCLSALSESPNMKLLDLSIKKKRNSKDFSKRESPKDQHRPPSPPQKEKEELAKKESPREQSRSPSPPLTEVEEPTELTLKAIDQKPKNTSEALRKSIEIPAPAFEPASRRKSKSLPASLSSSPSQSPTKQRPTQEEMEHQPRDRALSDTTVSYSSSYAYIAANPYAMFTKQKSQQPMELDKNSEAMLKGALKTLARPGYDPALVQAVTSAFMEELLVQLDAQPQGRIISSRPIAAVVREKNPPAAARALVFNPHS